WRSDSYAESPKTIMYPNMASRHRWLWKPLVSSDGVVLAGRGLWARTFDDVARPAGAGPPPVRGAGLMYMVTSALPGRVQHGPEGAVAQSLVMHEVEANFALRVPQGVCVDVGSAGSDPMRRAALVCGGMRGALGGPLVYPGRKVGEGPEAELTGQV